MELTSSCPIFLPLWSSISHGTPWGRNGLVESWESRMNWGMLRLSGMWGRSPEGEWNSVILRASEVQVLVLDSEMIMTITSSNQDTKFTYQVGCRRHCRWFSTTWLWLVLLAEMDSTCFIYHRCSPGGSFMLISVPGFRDGRIRAGRRTKGTTILCSVLI
jgi:hypothetical protein